ncbi:MAG: peptidase domain-containing ABC transporter [Bacteroidetes bacterium]|nr:peptidase domain-containing ABC transporter [Bacteroidota bacterium]MCL6101708.1 peptidase domain-containing ABC transporter [Bacteroidota bacterium]
MKVHKLIKKTFTKQYSQSYCGLACLTSIVKYHGGEITQEKLRETSGTTLQGTSLLGLYQSAQKLGFEVKGYEADAENLKKMEVPVILHILKEGKLEHYVVCYGYEAGSFTIGDPGSGIMEYTETELEAVWESKAMLLLKPGKDFKRKKTESKNQWNWIRGLIKEDVPVLSVAALMGVVLSVLGLAVAIYTQKLIDKILPSGDRELLFKSLGIFVAILLARAFIGYIRGIMLIRQSKDMNIRVVSSFFGKLLLLPESFFDSTSTGDMIGRLNDSQRIQRVVISLSSNILIDVLVVISSLAYIFMLSLSTGMITLLAIPVFGLLAWRYNKRVINKQREVMQTYALTESKYIDTIQGIRVIKSGNKESLLAKSVQVVYNFFQEKSFELGLLGNKINLWAQAGSVVLLSGVIAWSSFLVLGQQLLLGQMMAIVSIAGSLVTSVINTAMANIQFQEAKIAFERMYEFSAAEPEYVVDVHVPQEFVDIRTLELKELNFRFPGKGLLLKGISMKFEKGKAVTIFGEIGCGKSTLMAVLQRFYPFESGGICINGSDWSSMPVPEWRDHIAVVSQQVKLFNGTILENICLEEKPDVQQVVNFCIETGLDPFIREFQQGYATIIHENSANLSGGQQQLIALARALYQKPQVLLLDEATAAMDRRSEQFVLKLLQQKKKEMMIIFITHRVQLARQTDFIYVIEDKQVAASGTHEEIICSNRLYREAFEEILLVRS